MVIRTLPTRFLSLQTSALHALSGRTRGRLRASQGVVALAAGIVLSLLCGCERREHPEEQIRPLDEVTRRSDLVPAELQRGEVAKVVGAVDPMSPAVGVPTKGADSEPTFRGMRGADADYIDKADIYWHLNWIRRKLIHETVPNNLAKAIEKTRKELAYTKHDLNYDRADEALTHLEKGLEHFRAHQILLKTFVNTSMVPWNRGQEEAQQFIRSGGLGFGGSTTASGRTHSSRQDEDEDASRVSQMAPLSSNPELTPDQQKAVEIVLNYASTYHTSPEEMMRSEWKLAIEFTNHMRDALGLMNRDPNRDGDSTEINPANTSHPLEVEEVKKSGVPHLPESSLHEPTDLFEYDLPPSRRSH